jgi:hypothetical protein|eukprot:COSAG01_NODE_257_length_20101_cov_142.726427_3_plen_117_part_00
MKEPPRAWSRWQPRGVGLRDVLSLHRKKEVLHEVLRTQVRAVHAAAAKAFVQTSASRKLDRNWRHGTGTYYWAQLYIELREEHSSCRMEDVGAPSNRHCVSQTDGNSCTKKIGVVT